MGEHAGPTPGSLVRVGGRRLGGLESSTESEPSSQSWMDGEGTGMPRGVAGTAGGSLRAPQESPWCNSLHTRAATASIRTSFHEWCRATSQSWHPRPGLTSGPEMGVFDLPIIDGSPILFQFWSLSSVALGRGEAEHHRLVRRDRDGAVRGEPPQCGAEVGVRPEVAH